MGGDLTLQGGERAALKQPNLAVPGGRIELGSLAVAIVNALGSMGDIRGLEVLTALTNDKSVDPYVRESAVSALPRLDQVINYNRG